MMQDTEESTIKLSGRDMEILQKSLELTATRSNDSALTGCFVFWHKLEVLRNGIIADKEERTIKLSGKDMKLLQRGLEIKANSSNDNMLTGCFVLWSKLEVLKTTQNKESN